MNRSRTSSPSSSADDSPSPPASPVASDHGPPNLERLVLHFVAAKRSLISISHVSRADELVTISRHLIEEIALLTAKNAFAHRGVDDQIDVLDSIKDAVISGGETVADDFAATLATLDKADARLDRILTSLKDTSVDPSLQQTPSASRDASTEAAGSPVDKSQNKTLFDFIDENNHESILQDLRTLIDSYHAARSHLDEALDAYNTSLKEIADSLSDTLDGSGPPYKPTIYDEPPATLPQLFHGMERMATGMASLLENLVSHFDLSVQALKHTEGGGAAAKNAIDAENLPQGAPGNEESLYGKTVPEPIDEAARNEMLRIVEKDALEVDDVMEEIRNAEAAMEDHYSQIAKHASKARARNTNLRQALDLLRQLRSSVPTHLDAVQAFRATWLDIQSSMQSKTQEVSEHSDFYEQFLSGYSKLLRELERRKSSQVQMERVAERARSEMERLVDADRQARGKFLESVGDYLPRDIWYGLQHEAPRWEIRMVTPNEEET